MAKDHDPPKRPDGPQTPAPPRLEGSEMPDHLRHTQARHAEQPPKPAKLEQTKDDMGQAADAPPTPPAAKPEPVPRVIDQNERSPDRERLSRFKVRADQPFGAQPVRYVLAPKGDRQAAIDHYLEKTGLKAVMDAFPEGQRPTPIMLCKELPD